MIPGWRCSWGRDRRRSELADQVQDAWIAFARTGDPNHPSIPEWPGYDPSRRATMEFSEPCRLVEDPMSAERAFGNTCADGAFGAQSPERRAGSERPRLEHGGSAPYT